mgnify:FL=1
MPAYLLGLPALKFKVRIVTVTYSGESNESLRPYLDLEGLPVRSLSGDMMSFGVGATDLRSRDRPPASKECLGLLISLTGLVVLSIRHLS